MTEIQKFASEQVEKVVALGFAVRGKESGKIYMWRTTEEDGEVARFFGCAVARELKDGTEVNKDLNGIVAATATLQAEQEDGELVTQEELDIMPITVLDVDDAWNHWGSPVHATQGHGVLDVEEEKVAELLDDGLLVEVALVSGDELATAEGVPMRNEGTALIAKELLGKVLLRDENLSRHENRMAGLSPAPVSVGELETGLGDIE